MNDLVSVNSSGQEENLHAALAHGLCALFGWIPPLIFWLINKDNPDRAFVTDQAKEALNFQINLIVVLFVCALLTLILIGFLLFPAAVIAGIVFNIMGALAAYKGEVFRYPSFIIRLIK